MERPERDDLIPPIMAAVLKPALQVGALSGRTMAFSLVFVKDKRQLHLNR